MPLRVYHNQLNFYAYPSALIVERWMDDGSMTLFIQIEKLNVSLSRSKENLTIG